MGRPLVLLACLLPLLAGCKKVKAPPLTLELPDLNATLDATGFAINPKQSDHPGTSRIEPTDSPERARLLIKAMPAAKAPLVEWTKDGRGGLVLVFFNRNRITQLAGEQTLERCVKDASGGMAMGSRKMIGEPEYREVNGVRFALLEAQSKLNAGIGDLETRALQLVVFSRGECFTIDAGVVEQFFESRRELMRKLLESFTPAAP